MNEKPEVLVVGAGAIGLSIVGWIAPKYENLSVLARGETLETLKNRGLKTYLKDERSAAVPIHVRAVGSLAEIVSPDVVVISVKNYDLDSAAQELREQLGNREPLIVALQNGVYNQQVLPRYFSRVIYGVICFNAWRDAPADIGHDDEGYIILGTPKNDLREEMQKVKEIFNVGLDSVITDRLKDAAHCKLVINLANALTTLVRFPERPPKSFSSLAHMTLKLFLEGIQLLQAAGFHEHALGRIPTWRFIKIGAKLPGFMVSTVFRANIKNLGLNSMAQDVFAGKATTELETLNGYMLNLARQIDFPTPINKTVYEVAKERFAPNFKPVSEQELWNMIKASLS